VAVRQVARRCSLQHSPSALDALEHATSKNGQGWGKGARRALLDAATTHNAGGAAARDATGDVLFGSSGWEMLGASAFALWAAGMTASVCAACHVG